MTKWVHKGSFIVLEGPECCGKGTQLQLLVDRLKKEYPSTEIVVTREPGGTELGERVRPILKNAPYPISNTAELLLFAACRAQIVDQVIAPALERGAIVVCDRFAMSTAVYQGHGRGLDQDLIDRLEDIATRRGDNEYLPNLTVVMMVPVETTIARCQARDTADALSDRFEGAGREFLERVYDGYHQEILQDAYATPIDGTQTIEEIHESIWNLVQLRHEQIHRPGAFGSVNM